METKKTMKTAEVMEKSREKDKKYVVIREGDVSDVQWKVLRFHYSRWILVR